MEVSPRWLDGTAPARDEAPASPALAWPGSDPGLGSGSA